MNRDDILEQCFFRAEDLSKADLTELWTQAVIEASELRARKERALRLAPRAGMSAAMSPEVPIYDDIRIMIGGGFLAGVRWAHGELTDDEIGLDPELTK